MKWSELPSKVLLDRIANWFRIVSYGVCDWLIDCSVDVCDLGSLIMSKSVSFSTWVDFSFDGAICFFFPFFFHFFSHWVAECCQLIIHFSHNVENVIRYSGYRALIDLIFANGNLIINIYNNASLEYNIDTIHLCMPPLGISISESVSF